MAMPVTRLASEATSLLAGAAMAGLAAVRRGKAVHPFGGVRRATLVVPGRPAAPRAARLLAEPATHAAIVRFSRSLGLPEGLPDLLGLSLRVLDAYGPGRHQDVLMVSSIDLPVLHHVFVPSGDPQQRPFSTSLPYRAGGERFLIGALPGDAPDRLRLAVAPLEGRFQAVADLELGEELPGVADALRFNPWNTGGGLEPAGLLNRWRRRAYPMSQAAWGLTRGGANERAAAAERITGPPS
jgi:hypothetical protein